MPRMDHLIDLRAEELEKLKGEASFTSLDMQYVYGPFSVDTKAAEQWNFQIIGGEATVTYRLSTGFYGLTTMPTELSKTMDQFLDMLPDTYTFIDDILIVTKGTKIEHWAKVRKVLEGLDATNVHLTLNKCKFTQEMLSGWDFNCHGKQKIWEKSSVFT